MKFVVDYFRDLVRATLDGWDRFWFTPADAATLGVIRIAGGLMLLYTHAVWSIDLAAFYGPDAWLSSDLVRRGTTPLFWSYWFYVDSPALMWTLHIAALAVFAMFAAGLFSRVTSVLSFLIAVAYINRVQPAHFGLDHINVILPMYLMLAPCGGAYSLDRLIARRRAGGSLAPEASIATNIATRLIQWHMCLIYLFAGISKLRGITWWDGTALWYAFANREYQSLDMTWLARTSPGEIIVNILTFTTIAWEISYAFLIWPRRTRPIMLALAVPLHLGIGLLMGMMTFGLVMLIGNLAFVSPEFVRALVDRKSRDASAAQGTAAAPLAVPRAAKQAGERRR